MEIIKLNAINSTSSFLKEFAQNYNLKNYTVALTDKQTNGRGQQENRWFSEPYKNLTFSVFIQFEELKIHQKKYLNFAISLAIFEVLSNQNIPTLSIKWPNDILSENKKICGILIENRVLGQKINTSFIGIGLNVNQEVFPSFLKKVSSLKNETRKEYNLESLLKKIIKKIKEKITLLNQKKFEDLEKNYLNVLYKKDILSSFKNNKGALFMGRIIGISADGKLQIQLKNNTIEEFGIKEVVFI